MEEITENINKKNRGNIINKEDLQMKKENFNVDEFFFSFGNQKEIKDKNFFSNIKLEKEKEIVKNKNNYFEEENKEENDILKSILDELDENKKINFEEKENENSKVFQEIFDILRTPIDDKKIDLDISPFKPLLKPKKVSLVGRVLYNISNNENDNKN